MSRAYRIRVRESVSKVITAEDHVSTHLELLEILPADAMAELLKKQLESQGFEEHEGEMIKRDEKEGLIIAVDPKTGEVTVAAEASETVAVEGEASGWGDTDWGRGYRKESEAKLREGLRSDLEKKAEDQADRVQSEVTRKLERHLSGVKADLDRAVNRATAEALKQKAATLGEIKELTEDPEAGSMTIVLEV